MAVLHVSAEMLLAEGSSHLVVTHKSILRALLCVALGLPEIAFRAVDIHNGGICVFRLPPSSPSSSMVVQSSQVCHRDTGNNSTSCYNSPTETSF